MSLKDNRNSTTSPFSFLIGTIFRRHQNGFPADVGKGFALRPPNNTLKTVLTPQILLLNSVCVDSRPVLTIFPIKAHFSLVLLLALQGFVHLLDYTLAGFGSVEEAAGTRFLHHLIPNEAGQLTKPVGAVHDGVAVTTLSITQEEVTVCEGILKKERFLVKLLCDLEK